MVSFELILYVVLFLIVVYLIFKFVKKMIVAVFSVIFLVILIIAGMGFLIYSDINNLTSQNNYDVRILYENSGEYVLGVSVPIENQELSIEKLSSLDDAYLNEFEVDDFSDENNEFVVIINNDAFDELVVKENYNLRDIEGINLTGFEGYELSLTKSEVIGIINSEDGLDTLVGILFEKNDIDQNQREIMGPMVKDIISSNLEDLGISFREALFLFVISSSIESDEGVVNMLENYKEDDISIYPERISFKFLKLLPVSSVKSFIYSEEDVDVGVSEN